MTGSGTITIATKSTFEADAKLSAKTVTFASGGTAEVLSLKSPSTATSTISGFGTNTTIDLLNTGVTKLTYAGNTTSGTLTVRSGTSTVALLKFSGDYTTKSFGFKSDGHNGTDIFGTGLLTVSSADLTSVGGFHVGSSLASDPSGGSIGGGTGTWQETHAGLGDIVIGTHHA